MGITGGSTVALALLDTAEGLRLHSQFASGVNLRCADHLVYVSPEPKGGACALQVDAGDVELLRTCDEWRWTGQALVGRHRNQVVEIDPAPVSYAVEPPVLPRLGEDPDRLARARATVGADSWFDTGIGREVGLPRLRAAIRCLATTASDAPAQVRSVVGMGIGLTPSADDALVGALCVLAAAGVPCTETAQEVHAWLRAAGATTDVSASYLRLAFEGAFSVPLNRTVACLAEDVPDTWLTDAVRGLSALGATSGMDAAVGVQLAWESLVPTRTAHRS